MESTKKSKRQNGHQNMVLILTIVFNSTKKVTICSLVTQGKQSLGFHKDTVHIGA